MTPHDSDAGSGGDAAAGRMANRRNFDVAIDYALRRRLIPRRFMLDELFDDVRRGLG